MKEVAALREEEVEDVCGSSVSDLLQAPVGVGVGSCLLHLRTATNSHSLKPGNPGGVVFLQGGCVNCCTVVIRVSYRETLPAGNARQLGHRGPRGQTEDW